jgi:hypothetical protein
MYGGQAMAADGDWITLLGVAHVCPRLAGVQDLKAARRHPRMGMSLRAIEMFGNAIWQAKESAKSIWLVTLW